MPHVVFVPFDKHQSPRLFFMCGTRDLTLNTKLAFLHNHSISRQLFLDQYDLLLSLNNKITTRVQRTLIHFGQFELRLVCQDAIRWPQHYWHSEIIRFNSSIPPSNGSVTCQLVGQFSRLCLCLWCIQCPLKLGPNKSCPWVCTREAWSACWCWSPRPRPEFPHVRSCISRKTGGPHRM